MKLPIFRHKVIKNGENLTSNNSECQVVNMQSPVPEKIKYGLLFMTQEVKVMWMCTYLLTTLKKTASTTFFQFGSSQKKPGFFYSTVRKNMKKVQINRTNTFINFTSDPNKMTGNQILLQLFVP